MALVILPTTVVWDKTAFVFVLAMIVLAMFSDWADGHLARRLAVTSELGYVLDAMGDRAIHLALILLVVVRHDIHPVYAWLLIFRDILIYAIRVLSPSWLSQSRDLQWLSRLHATLLRLWLCSFFIRDGILLWGHADVFANVAFVAAQTCTVCCTITFAYWGIARSLGWMTVEPKPTGART